MGATAGAGVAAGRRAGLKGLLGGMTGGGTGAGATTGVGRAGTASPTGRMGATTGGGVDAAGAVLPGGRTATTGRTGSTGAGGGDAGHTPTQTQPPLSVTASRGNTLTLHRGNGDGHRRRPDTWWPHRDDNRHGGRRGRAQGLGQQGRRAACNYSGCGRRRGRRALALVHVEACGAFALFKGVGHELGASTLNAVGHGKGATHGRLSCRLLLGAPPRQHTFGLTRNKSATAPRMLRQKAKKLAKHGQAKSVDPEAMDWGDGTLAKGV